MSLSPYELGICITLFVIIGLSLPVKETSLRLIILHFLFAFSLVPLLVYTILGPGNLIYTSIICIGFILTILISDLGIHLTRPSLPINIYNLTTLLLSFSIFIGLWLLIQNGLPQLTALDLRDVYEVRGTTIYGGTLFVYLVSWQAKVVNPFLIAYGITNKKYMVGLVAFCLQLGTYLYTSHKIYLFSIGLVVLLIWILFEGSVSLTLSKVLSISVVSSYIVYLFSDLLIIPSIMIRRVFFLPPKAQTHYYDYFSENEFAYFSMSRVGFFIDEVYEESLPTIIGREYFSGASANAAYFADGYAQLGLLGILIVSIVLGFVLLIANSMIDSTDPIATTAVIIPFFSLINSALTTTLLTHGLVVGIALAILYSSIQTSNKREVIQ
ncbi:hypothetical protein [Halobellus rarus]|nr:hypothetical protein [Halobellus rarus]